MGDNNSHGGARKGAGRKPKAEEQTLIEKLSPLEDEALEALKDGLKDGQHWAVKLFMQYRYGMPKQVTEIQTTKQGSVAIKDWIDENLK